MQIDPVIQSILVIRRDNIGDLVCTTPLIAALRKHFPAARIDALVNSYNLPVLAGNPYLDHVFAYTKAKHRQPGESVLGVYWRRWRMMQALRKTSYDLAIIASTRQTARPLTLARQVKAKHILGFTEEGKPGQQHIALQVPYVQRAGLHLVEELAELLIPLGITGAIPALTVCATEAAHQQAQSRLATLPPAPLTLAIHISSRKPPQRWPAVQFIELMRGLHARHQARFMLFWSPGDEHNPHHPGDDRKAAEIMAAVADLPVLAYPTEALSELIGGLSVCDAMICSDGGAMHVGAGLGKPIVCFFGNSDATVWRPWGVPYRLLQKPSRDVKDIVADEALAAFTELLPEIKRGSML